MRADREPAIARVPQAYYAAFVRQRKDDVARVIREQREASLRIADGIADARVRRAFLKAEAQHERDLEDFWRRFFRRVRKQRHNQCSPAGGSAERRLGRSSPQPRPRPGSATGPIAPPSRAIQLAGYSGPVLDRKGRRGVYLAASYLSAKTATYGCARRLVRYVTDPEHVEWLNGAALTGANIGETRAEMSAAFGLVEDLNRAARANAKVVFHLIVQLPHDVSPAERAQIMARWCDDQFGSRNLPFVWAVHVPDVDGDQRNYHGHVAVTFRPLVRVAAYEWDAAREVRSELDSPEQFRVMRERFAQAMTEVAQEAGLNREYTALSHAARGLKIKPTEHLGAHKTREVRAGGYVAADARNRSKIRRNEAMLEIDRLKRRQAAMERRLARVRRFEARAVNEVRGVDLPPRRNRTPPHGIPTAARPQRVRMVAPKPVNIAAVTAGHHSQLATTGLASRPVARPIASSRATGASLARRPTSPSIAKTVDASLRPPLAPAVTCNASTVAIVDRPPMSSGTLANIVTRDAQAATTSSTSAPRVVSRPGRPSSSLNIPALVLGQRANPASMPGSVDAAPRIKPTLIAWARQMSVKRADPPAATNLSVTVAERLRPTRRYNRPTLHVSALIDRPGSPVDGVDDALLMAALGERANRRRKRAKAGAPQAMLAAAAQIDWATAAIGDDLPLGQVGGLDRAETLTLARPTAISTRIRKADVYIHDDGADGFGLDPRAAEALGITPARLDEPAEQAALADLRREQQRVFDRLVAEAVRRPLAFSQTGPRPWPRDLNPDLLKRLDRWSRDEGFRNDLFDAVEVQVRKAHAARDIALASSTPTNRPGSTNAQHMSDAPSGAGVKMPPVFHDDGGRVRIAAFHPTTGQPSDQLLMLLTLAGRYPHRVESAQDGKLMARVSKPAILRPLLHMWRDDERVAALVAATATASRAAGKPAWPADIVGAVNAYIDRVAGRAKSMRRSPTSDRGGGPAR